MDEWLRFVAGSVSFYSSPEGFSATVSYSFRVDRGFRLPAESEELNLERRITRSAKTSAEAIEAAVQAGREAYAYDIAHAKQIAREINGG